MNDKNDIPNDIAIIGTPKDYTESLYRFYFEVGEYNDLAKTIIADFLGTEKDSDLVSLPHGYELNLPIQCVPDLVRKLLEGNIAIYQIVRFAKVNGTWRSEDE
jgi:hypothetical protein